MSLEQYYGCYYLGQDGIYFQWSDWMKKNIDRHNSKHADKKIPYPSVFYYSYEQKFIRINKL